MTRGTPAPETVTLHVPFRVVKRGGRKEMRLPDGTTQPQRTDSTLVKALARAFRWKRMLESGEFATIAELAEREGIAPSYMTPAAFAAKIRTEYPAATTGRTAAVCRASAARPVVQPPRKGQTEAATGAAHSS